MALPVLGINNLAHILANELGVWDQK